ncbi:MAG: efflux RND transporter periplasmic adaptor subunit [Deltaproteobacteria bacterium]|nr:MAG: efflux RND transporter periplasmic adaptor subunit [Deltaproteobacteria bacterium]
MIRNFFTLKKMMIGVLALAALVWFSLPGSAQKKNPDKDQGHEGHQHEKHEHEAQKAGGLKHDDHPTAGRKDDGRKHNDHPAAGQKPGDHKEDAHKHDDHPHGDQPPGQVKLNPEAVKMANLKVEPVSVGSLADRVQLTGELVFNEEKTARVSSRLAGRVVKINADYGAELKKGDALAVIDSLELGQAQNAFLQAAASYRVAQKAYERARLLWQEKAISQAEFQERQAKFELAASERDYAENRLHLMGLTDPDIARLLRGGQKRKGPSFHAEVDSTFYLRSPIAGRVVDRKVTPGLVVKPEEELFVIADTATLWCFVQVPEKDLSLVKTGSPVIIRVSSLPQEEYSGAIDYIAAMVEKATRMTRARVKVDNLKGELKAGMFATIKVSSGSRMALNVPQTAVVGSGAEPYVFVEQEPGLYLKRVIKPGLKADGRVEALEGLKEGERVVVQGAFTLKSELEKEALEGGHAH